ncbi:MAG: STAS-like domain-containing protein [Treponema sp.]|nr:STAS-like domain-containing protein [Treponema sp.]
MSRPAGREAFLMAKAYIFKEIDKDEIVLDFNNVKVLAPSWADEFITGIKSEFSNTINYINTENPSVKASLKTVLET